MMTKAPKKFLLLYGSQTGQAQSICEEIAETASKHGLEAELHCLSQTDKKFSLERAQCLVLVTSTTGDGEPPDTASKFWRRLKKKTLTNTYLQHLSYALLGLGDSNYTNFCNCGKMFDKRLEELGAKRFYNSGWADDGTGLEVVVEPWMDGLWPALKKHLFHTADSTDSAAPVVNGGTNGTDSAVPVVNGGTNGALPVSNGTSDIDPLKSDIQKVRTLKSEEKESLEKLSIDANGGSEALPVPVFDCEMREKFEACLDPSWKEGSRGLRESRQPLCESKLTLPAVPPKYLKINYHPNEVLDTCVLPLHNKEPFPSAKSEVADARIVSATRLTRADAVKTAIDMELDISTAGFHYEPGDSFSIVCPNSAQEVHMLLNRLGLESEADTVFCLEVIEGTKKRTAKVPPFLPARCTLRHALLTSMDIRTPPKKAFLRSLAECASEASERRRLEELCSKQGAEEYAEHVRKPNLSILDILAAFPSCTPPIERLFEHLPRLQARPYSASSSPLSAPGRLHFVFNILEVPAGEGRCVARKGLCTSWLNTLTQAMQTHSHDTQVEDHMERLNLSPEKQIPVFSRGNQHFHLPEDLSTPIIMIGPGTGVAPFLGFLQHRLHLHSQAPDTALGESWLFYGCRHKERDFLYRAQMERLSEEGILSKLLVSFSRDGEDGPKYVQDMIRLHGSELVERIYDTETIVYVCGDASNMARNVTETWEQLLQEHKGLSADQARAYLMTMRLKKRYREDIWT